MHATTMLITGITGEIGSAISGIYKRKNIKLLTLDDYCLKKDIEPPPTRLLHLAARSDLSKPASIVESNIDYLRTVIREIKKTGIEEFVFFSSASVYGKQNKDDVNEEDSHVSPDIYGLSKLVGEKILEDSGFKTLCLRLPGVLEIRKSTNFLSRIFVRLVENRNIKLYNADNLFNNFMEINNLAEFIEGIELTRDFDVINLGNEKKLTIRQIIELMKNSLNSGSVIEYSDEYMPFYNLSISKAVTQYNFKPGNARDNILKWCSQRLLESK